MELSCLHIWVLYTAVKVNQSFTDWDGTSGHCPGPAQIRGSWNRLFRTGLNAENYAVSLNRLCHCSATFIVFFFPLISILVFFFFFKIKLNVLHFSQCQMPLPLSMCTTEVWYYLLYSLASCFFPPSYNI